MSVNEGQEGRVLRVIVLALVVAAAVLHPHRFEGAGDVVGFAGEEAREGQIAEDVEKTYVPFCQRQSTSPIQVGHGGSGNQLL